MKMYMQSIRMEPKPEIDPIDRDVWLVLAEDVGEARARFLDHLIARNVQLRKENNAEYVLKG